MPLNFFIAFAYKVTTSQRAAFRASLPDWAQTEGFNLEARTYNHNVTKDQMRLIMPDAEEMEQRRKAVSNLTQSSERFYGSGIKEPL